jgi:WD40 repeat protein
VEKGRVLSGSEKLAAYRTSVGSQLHRRQPRNSNRNATSFSTFLPAFPIKIWRTMPPIMRKSVVGGPLLGDRENANRGKEAQSSSVTFEPLVSDVLDENKSERFVLLPNSRYVSVLSFRTGKRIGTLIPGEHADDLLIIESTALALYPQPTQTVKDIMSDSNRTSGENAFRHVLLLGCRDGTIREFQLAALLDSDAKKSVSQKLGDFYFDGPVFRPHRVFQLSEDFPVIKQLSVPKLSSGGNATDGIFVYAIVEEGPKGGTSSSSLSKIHGSVLRLFLPSPIALDVVTGSITIKDDTAVFQIDRVKHAFKKSKSYAGPLRLLSIPSRQKGANLVLVARRTSLCVYHDQVNNNRKLSPAEFTIPSSDAITAIAVSPNGKDIACGYYSGEIRVMENLLALAEEYCILKERYKTGSDESGSVSLEKPTHPSKTMVSRKLHWHAHSVSSLSYDAVNSAAEPMLYSGGEESVLITWQLSRGTYRPADVLPRIALGGIVHLLCIEQLGQANGILVYSSDNAMHLFELHNRSQCWKVQGLAVSPGRAIIPSSPRMSINPQNPEKIVLASLGGAPGYIHWYDPDAQQVSKVLEVAPYNRVSRTEKGDSPMPSPSISHSHFSETGADLITVDTAPTENACVGAEQRLPDGSSVGVVTTLRFWKESTGSKPYEVVAAMTHPHGIRNRVSAVTLSCDGKYACTASADENAFRMWRQLSLETRQANENRMPSWLCECKITNPSGYSNFATGPNAMSFSKDSSILAIGYGNTITLWDHSEVTFLSSLTHLDTVGEVIQSIDFLRSRKLHDMVLSVSKSGVTLQSPFGVNGSRNLGWSWAVTKPIRSTSEITDSLYLTGADIVLLALHENESDESRVISIDALTGKQSKIYAQRISGKVVSMSANEPLSSRSNWGSKPRDLPISLFILTEGDKLLRIQQESFEVATEANMEQDFTFNLAPTLPLLGSVDAKNVKRTRTLLSRADLEEPVPKKLALDKFGSSVGELSRLASTELPKLGGAFSRAFVARHLRTPAR